ncbi:hypothetical protein BDE02_18G077600 [Populus trichocarpa]|nr:hypothetical protein BDE02_18G077600 [Populus trichocarpa]
MAAHQHDFSQIMCQRYRLAFSVSRIKLYFSCLLSATGASRLKLLLHILHNVQVDKHLTSILYRRNARNPEKKSDQIINEAESMTRKCETNKSQNRAREEAKCNAAG